MPATALIEAYARMVLINEYGSARGDSEGVYEFMTKSYLFSESGTETLVNHALFAHMLRIQSQWELLYKGTTNSIW